MGPFYQNGIESLYTKMDSVLETFITIKTVLERKRNDEVLVLYFGVHMYFPKSTKTGMLKVAFLSLKSRERPIKDLQTAALTVEKSFVNLSMLD